MVAIAAPTSVDKISFLLRCSHRDEALSDALRLGIQATLGVRFSSFFYFMNTDFFLFFDLFVLTFERFFSRIFCFFLIFEGFFLEKFWFLALAWATKNATLLRFDSRTPRKIDGIMLPRKNLACTEILTPYGSL